MLKMPQNRKQAGFTLIELITVLMIIGLLASMAVPKLEQVSHSARQQALNYAVQELNQREHLAWALVKISSEGWVSDEVLFATMDTGLGDGYGWVSGPSRYGAALRMQTSTIALDRSPSTAGTSGKWKPR